MVKVFKDKKGEIFNISDLVSHRLQTLEAKFSSLIGPGSANVLTGPELTLPSTSTKPTPLPRRDSLPILEVNITPQTICRASARPPAFLPTMPRIPSRLEGKWVSFFERSGLLGTKSGLKLWTQASANQRPSRH